MLERIKKDNTKNLFSNDLGLNCPVPIAIINTYLRILKPLYLLNINLQRDDSSLGEIIPAVLNILNKLENIKINRLKFKKCSYLFAKIKYNNLFL